MHDPAVLLRMLLWHLLWLSWDTHHELALASMSGCIRHMSDTDTYQMTDVFLISH